MASFDEVGFLSDEMEDWKRAAHDAYPEAFEYAYRANGMAARLMRKIPPAAPEEQKWAIAAFSRALGAFQNALLMIERGSLADARTLTRVCAETVIVAKALLVLPDTLEILKEAEAEHQIKAQRQAIELASQPADPDAIAALTESIAELELQYPKRRWLNIRTLAGKLFLHAFYEFAFRYPSGNAAHATLGAFVRHMPTDSEGKFHYFFGPDISDMASTLYTATYAITELLAVAAHQMECDTKDTIAFLNLQEHYRNAIKPILEAKIGEEEA
jgi:hypothetical protein